MQFLDYIKVIILVASAIIIFTTLLISNRNDSLKENFGFLLYSFLISLFLIFITVVKLHHILREAFNITNTITYAGYLLVIGYYAFTFRNKFLRFGYSLLITSVLFFGLAALIDLLSDGKLINIPDYNVLEDILYTTGVIFWLFFFITVFRKISAGLKR